MAGERDPGAAPRESDEVLASIAALAASDVEGVTGLGGGLSLGLGDVLAKRGAARGVRVEAGLRQAAFDVFVHVAYGVQIPTVAQRVQEAVKRAVETMTALTVVEVNVHVQGLDSGHGAARPAAPAAGQGT